MTHECDFRVYYEDTDAGGIVYYANYLKFAERGRTEFLRAAGFENSTLKKERGLIFVVRHLEADYLDSAQLDDILTIHTDMAQIRKARFVMKQSIFCHDKLLFSMTVTLACVADSGKPARIPEDIYKKLSIYLEP